MFFQNGKAVPIAPGFGYGIGDDGNLYSGGCPDGVDGVNYPAGTGPLYSEDGRAELGITEQPDQSRPDDRFFWVVDNGDGTFTATPKDLAELKTNMVKQVNQIANSMLQPTDWQITRKMERNVEVDSDVSAYRAEVIRSNNANRDAIATCKNVAKLQEVAFSWPEPLK